MQEQGRTGRAVTPASTVSLLQKATSSSPSFNSGLRVMHTPPMQQFHQVQYEINAVQGLCRGYSVDSPENVGMCSVIMHE